MQGGEGPLALFVVGSGALPCLPDSTVKSKASRGDMVGSNYIALLALQSLQQKVNQQSKWNSNISRNAFLGSESTLRLREAVCIRPHPPGAGSGWAWKHSPHHTSIHQGAQAHGHYLEPNTGSTRNSEARAAPRKPGFEVKSHIPEVQGPHGRLRLPSQAALSDGEEQPKLLDLGCRWAKTVNSLPVPAASRPQMRTCRHTQAHTPQMHMCMQAGTHIMHTHTHAQAYILHTHTHQMHTCMHTHARTSQMHACPHAHTHTYT